MRNYTFNPRNSLVKPYKIRGEFIHHATIIIHAANLEEAKQRLNRYYQIGVTLGCYKPQPV